jgi:hypothetical protein
MFNPRDGTEIETKDTPITVSGYVLTDSLSSVPVYVYDRSDRNWDRVASAPVDHGQPVNLGSGEWYPFATEITLPQDDRYWGWADSGKPEIRVKTGGNSDNETNSLFAFGTDSNDCMYQTFSSTGSPGSVIQNCSTGQSAGVEAQCGLQWQPCCEDGCAYAYQYCSSAGICRTRSYTGGTVSTGSSCGEGEGDPCTVHPDDCSRSPGFMASGTYECVGGELVCVADDSSYCGTCGGSCGECFEQPCGPLDPCNPGAECINGTCRDSLDCTPHVGLTGWCWTPQEVGSCSGTGTPTTFCLYDGQTYPAGESFPARDGCNTCTCQDDGQPTCTQNDC